MIEKSNADAQLEALCICRQRGEGFEAWPRSVCSLNMANPCFSHQVTHCGGSMIPKAYGFLFIWRLGRWLPRSLHTSQDHDEGMVFVFKHASSPRSLHNLDIDDQHYAGLSIGDGMGLETRP